MSIENKHCATSCFMMAVDLTPRFRRVYSQTRTLGENVQPGFSGPFLATKLWCNIIQALQTQVEVRCRRRHLRVYDSCFTGSDAVDVVLSHLMQNVFFGSSEVSRLKAARLCQALMEARVFETVGTKLFRRDKESLFEDTGCSLYRFLDCDALPGSSRKARDDSGVTENMTSEDLMKQRKKGSRRNELRTISNPLAVGSSDRRVEKLLKTINLQPSLPKVTTKAPATFLSKTVVEEVWRQQTLLQLLQAVELPVLDCILASSAQGREPYTQALPLWPPKAHQPDLVISNICLERELPQSLHFPELDEWLAAAADCLELFPDQLIVVVGEHLLQHGNTTQDITGPETLARQKTLLYDTMTKYYGSQERAPLLTGHYLDIHMAILGLLNGGKVEDAVRASQLFLRLLEPAARDELRRLLVFMATAAHPDAYRLHKHTDNRAVVSRTFVKAIVQNKEICRTQSERLVLFLMDNHTQLFKTPMPLIEGVRRTLQSLQEGRDPDNLTTFTFCQQVSLQQYEDQREAATLNSLKELIREISLKGDLSVKERRRLIKEFQKHHPVAFLQHLSSTF
ncbi:hypothetical protein UPYG_G00348270 [Umbra pygmaea]|uniref:DEP domain-containing protein n=1 Tax=Umbra pygmaea TaxID=75934 RepID=A0ABD0VXY5_UMBPY